MKAPSTANTPQKRWQFQCRAWEMLHEEHRATRAGWKDSVEAFKRWEHDEWIPRMKQLSVDRNAAMQERLDELLAKVPAQAREAIDAVVAGEKGSGSKDSSWDSDIDLRTV